MRAVVVYPGKNRSPELTDVPEPSPAPGQLRVKVLRVGVCGTDREILAGGHGAPPPGQERLVLGHESFGQVEDVAGGADGWSPGDYVVATVRRGCGACAHCAANMSDFCTTGGFVERGILGMDGFLAERYVEDPRYLVHIPPELREVGVLLEPLSVVEKAAQQALASQVRVPGKPTASFEPWQAGPPGWRPERVLVLGAGPIGILGALVLKLAGAGEVLAVERTERPAKHDLLAAAGIGYKATGGGPLREVLAGDRFDLILEATGSSQSVVDALPLLAANSVCCLTGVFPGNAAERSVPLDELLREMLYRNKSIVTTVNSNRSYFERGVQSMVEIERRWPGLLARLITRRMPMERYAEAVEPERDGVKTVVEVGR
jgi:threonine dehydrogenase-like Zn-dependent dehydrogenase